jgi:RecB family exonuclease
VITPRTTRLLRVPGLRAFHRAIALAASQPAIAHVRDTVIVVPSTGAADQLRHTLETLWLIERWQPAADECAAVGATGTATANANAATIILPPIVTRRGLYPHLAQRLADPPPMLDDLAREVLFRRAADAAVEQGCSPPFEVRPGLIPEMLALYDALRRQHRTIDDLERLVGGALEAGADIDHGARRLLQQTRFLVAAFRAYESSLAEEGTLDEHGLRARLLTESSPRPVRKIIVCVPDVRADAAGLWPADFDLLTRLPDLTGIDLVSTEAMLSTGYLERLFDTLPEIEVRAVPDVEAPTPTLLAPPASGRQDPLSFTSRDREEELATIAGLLTTSRRREGANGSHVPHNATPRAHAAPADAETLNAQSNTPRDAMLRAHAAPVDAAAEEAKAAAVAPQQGAARASLERTAVVYQRALPYLYLARQVFGAHGLPWQAMDALPLAAEPYAAALDLVLTFVASGYTRNSGIALLRSPHFRLVADVGADEAHEDDRGSGGEAPSLSDIAACDAALREADFLGGRERLADLVAAWERPDRAARLAGPLRALKALRAAADALAPLEEEALPSSHLATLEEFLLRHERLPRAGDATAARHLRARGAMLATIGGLRDAFLRHGERVGAFRDVAALVHRWLEGHTFNPRVGSEGLHLVDVPAAMFGRFSRVALVGVIEGEWPGASSRSIFYPSSLLRELNWPTEAERRSAARATFEDLLRLAGDEVMVSTFSLENDSIVRPSPFLEDLPTAGLPIARVGSDGLLAGVNGERGLLTVPAIETDRDEPRAWAALRAVRSDARDRGYHGWTGAIAPRAYSVTGIDRYLQCPFKYFAGAVLRLDEALDEQAGMTPLERGRFEHEVFQEFFARWDATGHGAIDEKQLDAARATFASVVDDLLPRIPAAEREIERTRLLGSAVSTGLGERIFRFEAARPLPIVERLLEYRLDEEYELPPAGSDAEESGAPMRVPKRVRLRGIADRVDLLEDGTMRLIDYKTGKGSGVNKTIQLPVYAFCAEQRLEHYRGRRWRVGEAGYLAFGRSDPYILAISAGDDATRVVNNAVAKLRETVERIEEGEFPVTPVEPHRCLFCGYAAVCRKDYVGDS